MFSIYYLKNPSLLMYGPSMHYTMVHFYRPILVTGRGSVKLYLTTDGGSVIIFTYTILQCVGTNMAHILSWVGKKDYRAHAQRTHPNSFWSARARQDAKCC
jgi:hypothetical protein